MKKIHIILALCFLYTLALNAENKLTKKAEAYLEKTRKLTGDVTENAMKGKKTNDAIGGKYDNFMDTVIWNDTFSKKTNKIPQLQMMVAGTESIVLDTPLNKLNQEWEKEEARLATLTQRDANRSRENKSIFTGGYCTFEKTILISKFNEYGKLDCLLNFGKGAYRRVEVFASFYPDYKREMVVAIPIYVSFENANRATFSGIVLKADKSSENLAGWVDNKRVQTMLAEGLLLTNYVAIDYVNGYMRALRQSRTNRKIDYIETTNPLTGAVTSNPVVSTNTAPPEVKDYLVSAGVNLLAGIFSIIGKDYIDSTSPLFAVYPQKLYIEGVVSFDQEGLAKRFGEISSGEENKINSSNQNWIQEKNTIINKYNVTPEGAASLGAK